MFVDFGIIVVTNINGRQHLYFRFKYSRFTVHKNNITVSPSLGNSSGNGYILIIISFIYHTYPYTVNGSKQFFFFCGTEIRRQPVKAWLVAAISLELVSLTQTHAGI